MAGVALIGGQRLEDSHTHETDLGSLNFPRVPEKETPRLPYQLFQIWAEGRVVRLQSYKQSNIKNAVMPCFI